MYTNPVEGSFSNPTSKLSFQPNDCTRKHNESQTFHA